MPFYRDELLHSRPTDCHQLKAIGDAHIVTAPDLNLSPFAHEISSVEAPKEGKFEEAYSMDIFFLQLPSHIHSFHHVLEIKTLEDHLLGRLHKQTKNKV